MKEPNENSESDSDVFKRPAFLPDKRPPTVPATELPPPEEEPVPVLADAAPAIDNSVALEQNSESNRPAKPKISVPPIPYNEPSWGGQPDKFYSLEEMKGGISLRNIPLDARSFHSFGRLDSCHVVMAHPTISRYHAVLQFRATFSNEDEKRGFYLYDLGSTHGTFLNKYRIKPKHYVKVQVGHMIKFGSSTRFFLLHGPDDDQEDESQFSYTQLKEMRKQELEKREADYLQQRAKLLGEGDNEEDEESKGIDWGMGEDADEATDLKENPFAPVTDESMYKDDPKKWLKQWFEREGEELHYRIEEKGYSQFRCTIELPIENAGGGAAVAEAIVSGRKKEAAFQCALEACRILDRAGVLRNSNQESRKRKLKNWEEDDYYDSDEDNFFDRTGELEAKRKQRMKQVHKTQPTTDTYESLIEKHKKVIQEIEEMERKLSAMIVEASGTEDNDNLDSFTSHKTSGQILDKLEFKKTKISLNALKTDEEKLRKLINFVKPFELPELKPPPRRVIKEEPAEEPPICEKNEPRDLKTEVKPVVEDISAPKAEVKSETPKEAPSEEKQSESIPAVKKRPPSKTKNSDRAKKIAESYSNQYEEDFNNIVWKPPTGQTGDGRTSLNDKYGY